MLSNERERNSEELKDKRKRKVEIKERERERRECGFVQLTFGFRHTLTPLLIPAHSDEKDDLKVLVSHLRSNKQISHIGLWEDPWALLPASFLEPKTIPYW
ncbi:hypothetical protein K1719_020804 [Acacia pycnantha]|nr:hypothetical protein K1719_020804 [Acacia pycnantha]